MSKNWKALRQKYPKFTFDSYSWKRQDDNLALEFMYSIPPDHKFTHRIAIENFPKKPNPAEFKNFIFHIGLALMSSYWKATCSPIIEIKVIGSLGKDQTKWWHKLFINGMGQYFYENQIDFTSPGFLAIRANQDKNWSPQTSFNTHKAVLIPIGGGKDSLVTLGLLKPHFSTTGFVFNPVPAVKELIKTARIPAVFVHSVIDPYLLDLNKQGYLNGHTPFSALLDFISVFVAAFSLHQFVAISDERSSDEGNTTYLGHTINHQYSKTLEFETDFQTYSHQFLSPNITFFSFLRPLYELQITYLFCQYPQYFNLFTSCNQNFTIDPKKHPQGLWCKTCPKCVSLALLLTPWIGKQKVTQIMGDYPLEMPQNQETLKELLGEKYVKPFECVLTREEAQLATHFNPHHPLLSSWLDNPNMPPQFTRILKIASAKKVLILGYGREGQSTHKFLSQRFPHLQVDTADQKDGPDYLKKITNYQIIFKTPGIKPHFPEIRRAKKQGKLITSQTQIFFDLCPGKIIGVTGTKGKSTTASLIYHVLSHNKIPSVLVGNIGKPMLDYLPEINSDTWVVAELSSFQLMDLTKSPHIAVLQNIFPDHLDYHQTFTEYWQAKANITLWQKPSDYLIYNSDNRLTKRIATKTKAKTISFSIKKPLLELKKTRLTGQHNLYNSMPAVTIGRLLKIPDQKIFSAIRSFKMLEHRLELVAIQKGVKFYADTLATIPEATIAALEALKPNVATLIAGGHERQQKYTQLAKKILDSQIEPLVLFPATGKRLGQEINSPKIKHFLVNSMSEAVKLAFKHTPEGKICLLSPAAPSFTLFKDYQDEAEQYKKEITKY